MKEKITSNISRPWNDLPMDLLELLVRHVTLVDSIRLCASCKVWNLTSNSIPMAKTCPWLMYQEKLDGTYKLLDSLNRKEYTTKIGLPWSVFPTKMLCSKDGWVIVLGGNRAVFMVNPIIQHIVKLPTLQVTDEDFHGITFTSIPTLLDCVVMGICTNRSDKYSIEFHVWHSGEEELTIIYDDEIPFSIANTNPVYLHGKLYYLGEAGELGVFDPVEQNWEMLDKPEPVYTEDNLPFMGTEDCYLLELGGDLVSVFRYNYFNYEICVFKLDKLKMEWIQLSRRPYRLDIFS
ncbi:F-box protein At3g56470-like [Carex rostrata]